MGTDRLGNEPPGENIRSKLDGFVEGKQWDKLAGFLTTWENLKLLTSQHFRPSVGTTGFLINTLLSSYLESIPQEVVSESERLSRLKSNLPAVAASIEMHQVRGCGELDPEAVCKECGSNTIVHGYKDLGGVDFYDNYFAVCTSCLWAWSTEVYSTFDSGDPVRDFNYVTNTY